MPLDSNASASHLIVNAQLQYLLGYLSKIFVYVAPTTELTKQVVDVTRPKRILEQITLDVYNQKYIWQVNILGNPPT